MREGEIRPKSMALSNPVAGTELAVVAKHESAKPRGRTHLMRG